MEGIIIVVVFFTVLYYISWRIDEAERERRFKSDREADAIDARRAAERAAAKRASHE